MKLRHVGIRPLHPLTLVDFKKKIYYEYYPDGSYKRWNLRMLKSGCGRATSDLIKLLECYYCPTCDEWFAVNQWETV